MMMAWLTVPNLHEDKYALDMLDMILDNSVAGLINLNLVQPQLVRDAGSYPNQHNNAGAQFFWASPREGQSMEDLEKLLLGQISKIKTGEFAEWLIPAIISDTKTYTQKSYESNEARVEMMRDSFIAHEPWADASQYISRLSAVTREDVIRVANKYFGDDYAVTHLVKGKPNLEHIEKPKIDAVTLNDKSESAFAKSIMAEKIQPLNPYFFEQGKDYQKTTAKWRGTKGTTPHHIQVCTPDRP